MACDSFTVDVVYRVSAFDVFVGGKADGNCRTLRIEAIFPGGIEVDGRADLSDPDSSGIRTWSCVLRLEGGAPSSWCKAADASIRGICFGADGKKICESAWQAKQIDCCPQVTSLGPVEGDCRRRPGAGGALDRDVRWRLRVDWPFQASAGNLIEIDLIVELTSDDDATYREQRSVRAEYPDAIVETPAFHLPSGSGWTVSSYISVPSYCTHPRELPHYVVPVCDPGPCPLPPAGDVFLTVRDSDGTIVTDPNDTGCVAGDFITVTAQGWPGDLTWRAEANSQSIAVVPTTDPRTVRVDMPTGDDRVTVIAQIVVDAVNGCIHSRNVTAKRCDCVPVPTDYALSVTDATGRTIRDGDCVDGDRVDVVAPDHEGGVVWAVDGQPRNGESGDLRRLTLTLGDENAHTVSATVGRGSCATTVQRTLQRCQSGVPAVHESFWPVIPWCFILMIAGLVAFVGGLLLLTIGVAAVASVVCWFELAGALVETVVGPFVVWIVWMVVTFGGIILGLILLVIGILLIVAWLALCRGCDDTKSPISFCDTVKWFLQFLSFLGPVTGIIETVIALASGIGGVVCGLGVASILGALSAIMWLIDMGALWALYKIVEYYGNAIGCVDTVPSSWPLKRAPPPSANSGLPCLDSTVRLK